MTIQYYKKKNPRTGVEDFREVGTNRYIGPTEFGSGGGFTEQNAQNYTNPRVDAATQTKTTPSPLGQFKSNQKFVDLVKQAIQRKQGMNKDIQSSRDYWRTQQRDPMTFTDERLRLLSPAQQQALREKRYATAGAHLQGLTEEEEYRGSRLEDVTKELLDLQQAELDASSNEQLNRSRALDYISKARDLGLPVSDEDYKSAGVDAYDGRVGASLSYRNSNPGNLKYSDWQKKYGAVKDPNSAFAKFPSVEKARDAYKALLTSPRGVYAGLTPDEAMWKWSGGGKDTQPSYTYQDLVKLGAPDVSKDFSLFTNDEWDRFFKAQQLQEGWDPGQELGANGEIVHVTWTPSAIRDLAVKTGISSTELLKNYTDEELDALELQSSTDINAEVASKVEPSILRKYGFKNRDELEKLLVLKYDLGATEEELKALADQLDIRLNLDSGLANDGEAALPFTITEILEKITNK
jgi:hypothetical protein